MVAYGKDNAAHAHALLAITKNSTTEAQQSLLYLEELAKKETGVYDHHRH